MFSTACLRTPASAGWKSTVTLLSGSGWHSGISWGVALAAMMPATRLTASASPLGRSPATSSATTSGRVHSTACAVASRVVSSFPLTSTMCALPSARTWVSLSCSLIEAILPRSVRPHGP